MCYCTVKHNSVCMIIYHSVKAYNCSISHMISLILPTPPADSRASIWCLFSDHLHSLAATLVTVIVLI